MGGTRSLEIQCDFVDPFVSRSRQQERAVFPGTDQSPGEDDDGAQLAKFREQLCYLSFGAPPDAERTKTAKYLEFYQNSGRQQRARTRQLLAAARASHAPSRMSWWGHRAGFGFCLARRYGGSGRVRNQRAALTASNVNGQYALLKTNTSHGRSRIKLMRVRSFDGNFISETPSKLSLKAVSNRYTN